MYRKVEGNLRMTAHEAAEQFPDSYILFRRDNRSLSHMMGTVLFVGDDRSELFSVLMKLDDTNLCGVMEGINHQYSLGGVVVGE